MCTLQSNDSYITPRKANRMQEMANRRQDIQNNTEALSTLHRHQEAMEIHQL